MARREGSTGAARPRRKRRKTTPHTLAGSDGISGSRRDPNRGSIEEFPFGGEIHVIPDRSPNPLGRLLACTTPAPRFTQGVPGAEGPKPQNIIYINVELMYCINLRY
jgi:hypothetical protein